MNYSNWTAIVVEDRYDDHRMAATILKHHGINVKVATNGNECLDLLEQDDVTVVITDLAMPEMDGWQLLVAMRSNPNWAHIPVIAVTAYHSAEVAEEVYQRGFDGYFPKPLAATYFIEQLQAIVAP